MKKWFNYFVYISLVFLVIALYKADYLNVPIIYSIKHFIFSLFFLLLGFAFDIFGWYKLLHNSNHTIITLKDSYKSMSFSIFGKYIPGKIWVIVGRSAYLSRRYNISEKKLTNLSIHAQFLSLWCGFTFSIIAVFLIKIEIIIGILIVSAWVGLSLLLFSRFFHNVFISIIKKILKKTISIPSLSLQQIRKAFYWYIINWLFWCIGFYFFAQSLSIEILPFYTAFMFAFAAVLGIIAIIMPGGLGVREGVLTTALLLIGLDETLAITIAVTSRLWFLIGEVCIFVVGLLCAHAQKKNNIP